ncbi:MAG: hypothetical protein LBE62_13120, partial [Azonexus sp.]|nr:hypothetical protein [Azonexus sp.]
MHRIDGAGHIDNRFVHEDAALNRPPTEVTADYLNAVQEEIASVIEAAEINLDKADNTQLYEAIHLLIQKNQPVFEPEAIATTATQTDDGDLGVARYAADNDKTSRNKAATPAGVAAQIAALPPSGLQVFTLATVPATKTAGEVIYVVGFGYWEWVETAYFVGYRHPECGNRYDGDIHSATPNWLVDAV